MYTYRKLFLRNIHYSISRILSVGFPSIFYIYGYKKLTTMRLVKPTGYLYLCAVHIRSLVNTSNKKSVRTEFKGPWCISSRIVRLTSKVSIRRHFHRIFTRETFVKSFPISFYLALLKKLILFCELDYKNEALYIHNVKIIFEYYIQILLYIYRERV